MYCSKCGQNNHDDAAFCAFCGAPLSAPEAIDEQTAAPVYTPEMSTPYSEPTEQEPFGTVSADSYEVQAVPEQKKSKKLWLIIPAAVIVLALIGALVVQFLYISSPQYQFFESLSSTFDVLEEKTNDARTFHEVYDDLAEYSDKKEARFVISADIDTIGDIELKYDCSIAKQFFRLDGGIDTDYLTFDFALAANREKLMLQFEQINDNVYSIPLENFGKEYQTSEIANLLANLDIGSDIERVLRTLSINLFAPTDWDTFRNTYPDFDELIVNLEVDEVDYAIPSTDDLTVYRAKLNAADLTKIYNQYTNFQREQLLGKEAASELAQEDGDLFDLDEDTTLILYFGINDDDCLSAIYGYEEGCEDEAGGIILAGNKNIWDEVLIYEGDTEIGGFTYRTTESGFAVDFFDTYAGAGRETIGTLECDDAAGEIRIALEDKEFTVNYAYENDKITFSFEIEDAAELSITVAPFRGVSEIEGEEIELFDCNETELQTAAMELLDYFGLVG